MELLIPLNTQADTPLYEQIYEFIRDEVRSGSIKPARQLPSTRDLARTLKVSRSTTQLAYEQLAAEGYLEAVPRKGYFTANIESLPFMEGLPPANDRAADFESGPGLEEKRRDDTAVSVDFSPRGIDLESFPYSTWRKISRSVLKEEGKEIFLKGDSQGDLGFREAIRDYLHRARGVNCDVSQIIVGAGNEFLLILLSQLLGREMRIAMENPTYKQAYYVLKGQGHPVIPVAMDKSGMDVSELEKSGAGLAYVMPSHQFPMGIVMPVRRRQELLYWAERGQGRYILEDDYDSEFRYKGKPVPALQGMDRSGRVIYMGTFSKAVAPAIRIGYLVLPHSLLRIYRRKAMFYSSTVSRVDQRILEQFLSGGYYERHLNRMREIYKGKHDALLLALKPLNRIFALEGEHAGLHILLTYRGEREEGWLIKRAEDAGVRVYGLSGFFIHRERVESQKTVILGYARLSEEEIEAGAKLLIDAWKE